MTLSFLKILILDIGISLGDTVTDMLQGFSLIIDDGSLSFRISTMRYGIAIILASWLPVMIATKQDCPGVAVENLGNWFISSCFNFSL